MIKSKKYYDDFRAKVEMEMKLSSKDERKMVILKLIHYLTRNKKCLKRVNAWARKQNRKIYYYRVERISSLIPEALKEIDDLSNYINSFKDEVNRLYFSHYFHLL